ncbi:WYL domain-containing protein [Paenibacillus methanolicus]|uniref:WYL domain-containing protein n=1 Tax=Paenibacillus methanolicus TaxID=582686 RepID=A0A5S5BMH4_9BACL|nr:WYL domain-containing protein [Paenibacillus methanolicus]TYP68341.1 WYL domain-containing protein [Paenibacillus methanolicus]
MNLFEKMFNYQVMAKLGESGTVALTRHERAWLKSMLTHPAAESALAPETREKLVAILADEPDAGYLGGLQEKARSVERQVHHPLLRPLRRIIAAKKGMRITYTLRNGSVQRNVRGFPYKLEYSMVKREWYVLWMHLRRRAWMATKLSNIMLVEYSAMSEEAAEANLARISTVLADRKNQLTLAVVPAYNRELSRILYALSCFEKEVEYDELSDTYQIQLEFSGDDSDYVLSKIRFLGMRVIIVEGAYHQRRMYESATKALVRYGVTDDADSQPSDPAEVSETAGEKDAG